MNKLLTAATTFVVFMLTVAFFTISNESKAGIFDDITTAITGHIDDAKSRINSTDTFIVGKTIASGSFRSDDAGQDFAHRGSGDVSIIKKDGSYYLQLGDNFTTTPGPDYHIYVSTTTGIDTKAKFKAATTYEIAKLSQGVGAHFYKLDIPFYIDIESFDSASITIWCKAFGAFITSADITK